MSAKLNARDEALSSDLEGMIADLRNAAYLALDMHRRVYSDVSYAKPGRHLLDIDQLESEVATFAILEVKRRADELDAFYQRGPS